MTPTSSSKALSISGGEKPVAWPKYQNHRGDQKVSATNDPFRGRLDRGLEVTPRVMVE
ncbi:hypothetical protein ACU8KH_04975 [Lachancea thermotolerans]